MDKLEMRLAQTKSELAQKDSETEMKLSWQSEHFFLFPRSFKAGLVNPPSLHFTCLPLILIKERKRNLGQST
jgi:hypothetical protein